MLSSKEKLCEYASLSMSANPSRLKKLLIPLIRVPVVVFMLFAFLLLVAQHSLIYHPSSYGKAYALELPGGALELDYSTTEGPQRSFYLPHRNPAKKQPDRIWVMFGGNGTRALDWADFVADCPLKDDGFVLIEYPGYGFCKGSASPKSIAESTEKAVSLVGNTLQLAPAALESKLNVAAHSIGCGAALNFAARHSVSKVVLVAPFTSLRDMARKIVGTPLCYVLLTNFDNRARVRELAALPRPPRIAIFHGEEDNIIPARMGRELSLIAPRIIHFESVPDADHNDVISMARFRIFSAMSL
jgi:hypothetical protein